MSDNTTPNNVSHSIAKVLGIASTPTKTPITIDHDEGVTDFEFAQKNMRLLITSGTVALDEMMEIARASQHARAFEVWGQLFEKMIAANKTLIDTKKVNSTIDSLDEKDKSPIVNNNLFVGSTAELSKFLAEKKKNETKGE